MSERLYVPINDSFLEELDRRDKFTSLYLKENPGSQAPAALDQKSLPILKRLETEIERVEANAPEQDRIHKK